MLSKRLQKSPSLQEDSVLSRCIVLDILLKTVETPAQTREVSVSTIQ